VSTGSYAIFAGGFDNYTGGLNVVEAYDKSLTRIILTPLVQARSALAGASVGDYALFAGGSGGAYYNTVDAYDISLTRTTPTVLSVGRGELAGASVENYAIFAGGTGTNAYNSTVDVYFFNDPSLIYIPITEGSKYKLNSDVEVTATSSTILKFKDLLNGYIKYKKGVI
jgi:hypothetical protein